MEFSKYLVNFSTTHRKFYKVTYNSVTTVWETSWGRLGAQNPASKEVTKNEAIEKIYEKKHKGYVEVPEELANGYKTYRSHQDVATIAFEELVKAFGWTHFLEEISAQMIDSAEDSDEYVGEKKLKASAIVDEAAQKVKEILG